ncbi:CPBP family intramembrane glutamic endopeptidase [Longirhabdus pacifica]|uniref:CPBP family intramembrane glutamic endopeptidase n=1 Tax=Longirhabdus pacifica TaxID=2305227 RepID=UPI0010086F83|nr:type II CAAX endopeptidase family protein [Longirhabdus pacifica]
MKKKKYRLKFKRVNIDNISDRLLLINLYFTQGLTLTIALIMLFFQQRVPPGLFSPLSNYETWLWWGLGFAIVLMLLDLVLSQFVPEHVIDDGGVNEKIFGNRNILHIAVLSFIVAFCEEMLFRGALQHAWGNYWTSVFFAAIHFRYLQHWLMTSIVFASSFGLGYIYDVTGTLWAPIFAHFLIDFISGCVLRFRRKK